MNTIGIKLLTPLVLTMAVLCTSCGKKNEQEQVEVVRPARLVVVKGAVDQRLNRYPATVRSSRASDMSFPVGGLLQELAVSEAERVEEGQLIAKLDQRDFVSKVSSAKAQFDNAKSEYERAVRLAKEDAIARSTLEQRKSQLDTARAQLDAAEKALSDTELRAPFSGVISKVGVEQFQNLQSGVVVASLFAGGTFEALVDIPARVIAESALRTNTGIVVVFDSAPANPLPATFREASLEADPASQTYEVTFSFNPPGNLVILPGMNATVVITSSRVGKDTDANSDVRVPLGAVLSEGGEQFVWMVNVETMAVSKQLITVADGIGESLTVTKGLAPGDTIVGAGASYLAEGMIVRPLSL